MLRKIISTKVQRIKPNKDRHQLEGTFPQNMERDDIRTAYLQDLMHTILFNHRQIHGTTERRKSWRKVARISRVKLDEKKEAEGNSVCQRKY